MNKAIFITGATGGLGRELVRLFLEKTDERLLLLVRPKASDSHEDRIAKLLARMGINGRSKDRIRVIPGDITKPHLGLSEADLKAVVEDVDEFYHSAALTNLGATREEAARINLNGTINALDLAQKCLKGGRLKQFFYFSTAYVAGSLTPIHALEDELPENPSFANSYEETKFLAEKEVRQASRAGLPTTIFRPSIVVGDSHTGAISEFNVIYPFWRIFAHGLLKRLPSRLEHTFNIVPIDFVVDAAFALSRRKDTHGRTYHLVSENPPSLEMVLRVKREYAHVPSLDIVPPEEFSLDELAPDERAIYSMLGPYLGYLGGSLSFDTKNTREALKGTGVSFPNTDQAFLRKIIDYAFDKGYFLR